MASTIETPSGLSSGQAMDLEARYGAHNYHPLPVVLSRGEGVFFWDAGGKALLRLPLRLLGREPGPPAPAASSRHGEQAERVTLTSRAFYNDAWALSRNSPSFGYEKVLPMNTGAEAVETALKMARRWGYR